MAKSVMYRTKERKCDICDVYDQGLQHMVCDLCEAVSHTKCLGFGDKEYKMWSTETAMYFVCVECRASPQLKQFKELRRQNDVIEQFIYKIDERIQTHSADTNLIGSGLQLMGENIKQALKKITEVGETMSKSMNELQECIQSVAAGSCIDNNPTKESESYATVVKAKNQSKSVCVIKPKDDKQNRATTKKTVMSEIDPVHTKVAGIRGIGKSGVGILCENAQVLNEVKEIAEKKLGENYNVTVPPPLYPRLKISGLSEKVPDDELKKMIIAQNNLDVQENEIKVTSIHTTRRKIFFDAIVEVPPRLYRDLLERGRVNIGWNACYVADGVNVRRCIKCCGYGHLVKDCREDSYHCQNCAQKHDTKLCENLVKSCVNCLRANKKFALKLCTNHAASSPDCHVYQREMKLLREKLVFV